jgi:hypothetical protein
MFRELSEWNKSKIAYRTTNQEEIKCLSRDENSTIKIIIANNQNTEEDILEEMLKYDNFWINSAIAKHKNTSSNTLRKLAEETNIWSIKKLIIENKNTPTDVLKNLSKNEKDKFVGERKINFKF